MLDITRRGAVLHVRLNRPEVRNAFNGELIEALHRAVSSIEDGVRALVLSGEGAVFCAGADLNWMRALAGWTREQHEADAERLFDMLRALDTCAVPTVARVHGAALGGGMGLIAACDVVVAAEGTQLGFTEAKLGLLPAVIAPFCVAKIGPGHARALFATAERFDAARGAQIGLVHRVVPDGQLDTAVEAVLSELLTSAPTATAGARELVRRVAWQAPSDVRAYVAELNAGSRWSDEGREGMSAFLEKRRPRWAER
ncbi:MAG TPA: enoyl-CoA hydratase-related protein [Chloroflexota bacterium]|nr:enoyl-CoA hydratase-related protein [Chloroflexota bacterium]